MNWAVTFTFIESFSTMVVHPQHTRSRTLTVVVTHPGINSHNCSLTWSSDHTTINPLDHWYSTFLSMKEDFFFVFSEHCVGLCSGPLSSLARFLTISIYKYIILENNCKWGKLLKFLKYSCLQLWNLNFMHKIWKTKSKNVFRLSWMNC